MSKTKSLPFKRPTPIKLPAEKLSHYGYILSTDEGPTFLSPVTLRGIFSIRPVFASELDGWKEAAYQAIEHGRDPSAYIAAAATSADRGGAGKKE